MKNVYQPSNEYHGHLTRASFSFLEQSGILTPENQNLVINHAYPDELANTLDLLQQHGILNQANFDVVGNSIFPFHLMSSIIGLNNNGLLSPENRALIAKHPFPENLAKLISALHVAKILSQENFVLIATQENPEKIVRAVLYLNKADILTQENRDMLATHAKPDELANALCYLQSSGILTSENKAAIATHNNLNHLEQALEFLNAHGILNQANFDLFRNHANILSLTHAFVELQKYEILTPENLEIIATQNNPKAHAKILSSLHLARIFTPNNRGRVEAHARPDSLCEVLLCLQRHVILNQENFDLVITQANTSHLSRMLSYLSDARILNQENFITVTTHANLEDLADVTLHLQFQRILNLTNFHLVADHPNPAVLANVLNFLGDADILHRINFNALMAQNHDVLITAEVCDIIWSRIPRELLTLVNFERLLTAAEDANPIAALVHIRDELIGVELRAANFNPRQSTHTASVHRSVSESAVRLRSSYGEKINLNMIITDIKAYLNSLEGTPKNLAAKRCIARISAPYYSFIDSASTVSTLELLAFAWLAIHDMNKCKDAGGNPIALEDAKTLLVEGLYEIQRGGNLDYLGNDTGGEDSPICHAGTFNKLMEKLNGIHQDVEVYYITHEGASSKLPKLIQEHASAYLRSLAKPSHALEYEQVKALFIRLKECGNLEPIWHSIKDSVKATLWDEFKEAYASNETDRHFVDLINFGYETQIPNIDELEARLETSGYQTSQVNSLWANRHSSPQAQHHFDQQYGLIIKP